MSDHKHSIFVKPAGDEVDQDRCTILVSAHYQEFDSPTTHIRFAYDRMQPMQDKPYQTTMRVGMVPSVVDIGRLEWGQCELVLGHQLARLSSHAENADILLQAQRENKIELLDLDGKSIGWIMPDRAWFGHFSGPIQVRTTKATAILHITALPATNA